jgi:hypothetical protein
MFGGGPTRSPRRRLSTHYFINGRWIHWVTRFYPIINMKLSAGVGYTRIRLRGKPDISTEPALRARTQIKC